MALLRNTTVYGTLSGSGVIYDPSGNSTQWNLGYSLASGVSGSLTGYALKSQTGSFVTTAQTGLFYAASNPSGYITGVNLSAYATYAQLTGLSGYDVSTYYPKSNPSGFITGYQGNGAQAGRIGINQSPIYFNIDSTNIGNSYGTLGVGAAGNVSIYPNSNLLLNPVGKVGIQNSSPAYDLDVIGSGNFSSGLYINNNSVATVISVNSQSAGTYTLQSSDAGNYLYFTNSTGCTVTVPPQSSAIWNNGANVMLEQSSQNGRITITSGAGVSISTSSSYYSRTGSSVIALVRKSQDNWILFGDIL